MLQEVAHDFERLHTDAFTLRCQELVNDSAKKHMNIQIHKVTMSTSKIMLIEYKSIRKKYFDDAVLKKIFFIFTIAESQ